MVKITILNKLKNNTVNTVQLDFRILLQTKLARIFFSALKKSILKLYLYSLLILSDLIIIFVSFEA
jgi:hypothetical protein